MKTILKSSRQVIDCLGSYSRRFCTLIALVIGLFVTAPGFSQCHAPNFGSTSTSCPGLVTFNVRSQGSTSGISSLVHRWYTTSSGGTAFTTTTPTIPTSGVWVSSYQTSLSVATTYWVSAFCNGSSETARFAVTFTPNLGSLSITTGGNPPNLCIGNSITLTPNGGYNYSWSSNPAGASGSGAITVSPTVNTTYTLSGIESNCNTNRTAVITITVDPKVGQVSTPSGPTSICQGTTSSSYSAIATNLNYLSWSLSPTTAGSINASGVVTWNTSFSGGATIGVTAFSANNCNHTTNASLPVQVNAAVLVPSTSPSVLSVCGIASISASGLLANEVFRYYTVPSGGSPTSFTSSFNTPVHQPGTYYYYLSKFNQVTGCESTRVTVTLSVGPPSLPGNVGNQTITCGSVTLAPTGAVVGETYRWYPSLTTSSFLAEGLTFTPTISVNTTYFVSKRNGFCESGRVAQTITVNPLSVPANVGPQSITCGTVTLAPSGATTQETYRWYSDNTTTTVLSQGNTYTPTLLSNTTLFVSKRNTTTGCESGRVSQTITVNPLPVPTNVGAQTVTCGLVTLSPSGANGQEAYRWYANNTTTSVLNQGSTYSPNLQTSTTFFVSKRNLTTNCESSRVQQVITVNQFGPPTVTSATAVYGNSASLGASGAQAGEEYRWYNSLNQLVGNGLTYTTPPLTSAVTINYFVTRYNPSTSCETPYANKATLPITLTSPAPIQPAGSTNTCGDRVLTFGSAPAGVTWYWHGTNSNSTATNNALAPNATVPIMSAGPFYVRARVDFLDLWSTSMQVSTQASTPDPADLVVTNYNPANTLIQATNSIRMLPGFTVPAGSTLTARIAITPECNDHVNWVEETAYDANGNPIMQSRTYVDGVGAELQSQTKDFLSGRIFAAQPVLNQYGVPVGSTLGAPIVESSFMYKRRFMSDVEGFPYSADDFDVRTGTAVGTVNNPRPVGTQPGTVGWYYSNSNNLEPATATTQFPYDRGFQEEGPDPTASTSASPGDPYRMGSGREVKSNRYPSTTTELSHYYALTTHFFAKTASAGYKYVSTDPDGKRAVSFVDADGRTLASALITGGTAPNFTYDFWSYTFYNDVGQVLATVAPKDVNTASTAKPVCTELKYDHLGRMIESISPDEGLSQYVYSLDGKIRFSQNQVQRNLPFPRFSYTNYDRFGRLVESGEYEQGAYIFQPHSTPGTIPANSILQILENVFTKPIDQVGTEYVGVSKKKEPTKCFDHTFITYDLPGTGAPPSQTFLFGQITKTENENATTHYSYDEFGQLLWTQQTITGFATKRVEYSYDYFGNVSQVAYQPGQPDRFYHHYEYDVNQRLTNVLTSLDATNKTLHARYKYYLHGPLKRLELAGSLQGIDYVYTLNGALKSINHSDPARDPGGDGANGFSADVFGQLMDYHDNDYQGAGYQVGSVTTGIANSFGGTLRSASWFSPVDNPATRRVYGYEYDSRNQLTNARFGNLTGAAGSYAAAFSPTENYREGIGGYDKNGNIQTLLRKGKTGNTLGNYNYIYTPNTNQLDKINHNGSQLVDYTYNPIGQMVAQTEGGKTWNVSYTAYGLVKEVKTATNVMVARYAYDDGGNRVKKESFTPTGTLEKTTWYVHDASGNVLAVYEQQGATTTLAEVPLYGAGRLGMYKPVPARFLYEINDHLGNVRAVIGPPETVVSTATMETENAAAEDDEFKSTIAPRIPYTAANNTPGGNEVIGVNNGQPNGGYPGRMVGPGIKLKVSPGDVISAEVWGYYEAGTGFNNTMASNVVAGAVANVFSVAAPGEASQLAAAFNQTYSASGFAGKDGSPDATIPAGYINLVMFDNSINADPTTLPMAATRITAVAGVKQKLTVGPITIPSPGYVYIYVNNNSNTNQWVYFDDLKVTHVKSPFVAGADFYPFGLTMTDREILKEAYRYGYQGQYAEEDGETGWNSFDLRMYDARFGRWLSQDPYNEFHSDYLGMGNRPNMTTDPTGGITNLPEVVITASRISSIASQVAKNVAVAVGNHLLTNAATSALCPSCPDPFYGEWKIGQEYTFAEDGPHKGAVYRLGSLDPTLGKDNWVKISDGMLPNFTVSSIDKSFLGSGKRAASGLFNPLVDVISTVVSSTRNGILEYMYGEGKYKLWYPKKLDEDGLFRYTDKNGFIPDGEERYRELMANTIMTNFTVIEWYLPALPVHRNPFIQEVGDFAVKTYVGDQVGKVVDKAVGVH
jgi:RHS repeat-associated protein